MSVVDEGLISGYGYAIVRVRDGQYLWWVERPGGTVCWRGNCHSVPATSQEAREQILAEMARYGIGRAQAENPS